MRFRTVDFFYLPLILVLSGYFIPFWASAQQTYGLRLGMNMSTFRLSIDDSDSVNPFQFKYVMGIASGGMPVLDLVDCFLYSRNSNTRGLGAVGLWTIVQ